MATAEGWLIKRTLARSARFNALNGDDFTQKVYCLLIACKDSWGMLPADPFSLKGELGPKDDTHPPEDFKAAVEKLASVGLVFLWDHQGDPWLYVVGHDEIHNPTRRKAEPEVPRPQLSEINKKVKQIMTNSRLNQDSLTTKSATLPRARAPAGEGLRVKGKGLRENKSGVSSDLNSGIRKSKKKNKPPHPGEAYRKELQDLSDHHAALFGRQSIKVQMNDHIKRIVKVLEKFGIKTCKLIQAGHKAIERNKSFMGWINAYPPQRVDGKRKTSEPDWEWIENHRAAGEKERPENQSFVD